MKILLFTFREQPGIMNKREVIDRALLAISPALSMTLLEPDTGKRGIHRVAVDPLRTREPLVLVADVRKVDRRSELSWFAANAPRGASLLVTHHMTPALAEECRQKGIAFIDTAGNANLQFPGCYVFVSGRPKPSEPFAVKAHSALRSASTLRVMFAFLTQPGLATASMREIAQASGVAVGTTCGAIGSLQALGFLAGGSRRRRLLAAEEMALTWAQHYPVALRDKLHPQRYSCVGRDWRKTVHPDGVREVWGGEVAAQILTNYLIPETGRLYTWAPRSTLMQAHRLRPDPRGDIEILDAFWPRPGPTVENTAPPLLVYADLMAMNDGRCAEVARCLENRLV
ncbi:MAG: hypothetical protein LWW96_20465 [Acidovorax sp.]|uniref:type IV toxin-antitoxin system AbiEi family antitoxin n=1 Tax=Acidovorax sp. TaxID=1872122 RepID=UPI0025BE363B|nr:type IV toxin-antitoxin system AbiEi family antitoxin [Acidovorax sp.]MCE1194526.1 hypothetical protein [Acidovorax sp.]